ncbi:hypothetical protein CTI12_AA251660 [Artemisia annua]|uniref:Neprosin PEP catalytic domain-containing protein n=1 Tax=Artemisia annua TaxID=35608 RepID=A0A2U1MDC0_ARTAN|nr:hypothetical protein CTI12_AA251660 [Artemisia annua]
MAFKLRNFFLLLIACTSIVTSQTTGIPIKHAIKTIRVKGGDIIDCVDIYKQPAFNHPALKNHTIQMKSHLHSASEQTKTLQNSTSSSKVPSQTWHKYGRCPNGTIPIRRPSMNYPTKFRRRHDITNANHSFTVVLTEGFSYSGAKANIKVFRPFVESNDDYSSSQVMIRNGPLRSFETIEAGWAVNPRAYNDDKTHFFAYWTVDGMNNTGCFDLNCPGFVQTSIDVLLGADITDYYGSDITIQISKDPYKQNWWLKFNDVEIGYWPPEILPRLRHQGTLVQWGGEVCSPKVGTHPGHTSTAMGSGQTADIFGSSGTISKMLIEENSHELKQPEYFFTNTDEWDCYDQYFRKDEVPEPVFYYGGPGSRNNPRCP